MKKISKGISFFDALVLLIILASAAIMIYLIILSVLNAANKINEGIVIDKNYYAEYVSYTQSKSGDTNIIIPYTEPARYTITIQGEKDDKTVEYCFIVSEQEYFQYKIGDYYKK